MKFGTGGLAYRRWLAVLESFVLVGVLLCTTRALAIEKKIEFETLRPPYSRAYFQAHQKKHVHHGLPSGEEADRGPDSAEGGPLPDEGGFAPVNSAPSSE